MLSVIAKQLSSRVSTRSALCLCNNSGKRSYYHESFFQLNKFKTAFDRAPVDNNSYKSVIEQSLSKPDSKLFTEDIRSFLLTARNDVDLNLLIKAIEKYSEQESSTLFGYKFDVPLMKLFYTLDKVDRALEIALQDNQKVFNYSTNSLSILMNKLVVDNRFDDAIKLYQKAKSSLPQGQSLRESLIDLYLEALLQKNTPDTLKLAKECVSTLNKTNPTFESKLRKIFLLALNQNDANYAYELIPLFSKTSPRTVHNFKLIALTRLNRMDEALTCEKALQKDVPFRGSNLIYFQETVEELKKAAEKPENAKYKTQIEEILKNSEGKTANMDLKSYLLRTKEPRAQDDRRPKFDDNRRDRNYQSDRNDSRRQSGGDNQRQFRKRDDNYSSNDRRRDQGSYNNDRDYQRSSKNRETRNRDSDRNNRSDREEFQYLRKK